MTDKKTIQLSHSPRDLSRAVEFIQHGGVVAVPTETVYGLAADASNEDAVAKIFSAKQRPNNHPLIVHIHSLKQLSELAVEIPKQAYLLAEAFWPGPLTLLLKKSSSVIDAVTGQLPTVGIRMPDHPILRDMLVQGNLFIAAPSANPHKQLSPTTAAQVFNELNGKIDAVIDGGACKVGLESTIVDLTSVNDGGPITVLRAGPITASMLSAVLGEKVQSYTDHQQQVPGNITQHYQPKSRLQVVTTEQILAQIAQWPSTTACLVHSEQVLEKFAAGAPVVAMSSHKDSYARDLYQALYNLDQQGFERIWVEQPPTSEAWEDVNDRLRRAQA